MLIRHAAHDQVGTTLSGRREGIPLAAAGQRQAKALAKKLSSDPPHVVQSSPVQRARETAEAIADACGLEVETAEALDEIEFGEWTGRTFDELADDPLWSRWNTLRSQASPPAGESMTAAQQRAVAHLRAVAAEFAGRTVAMVTHCDIIRAVVAAILGLSLDKVLQFDIDPASISRVAAGAWGEKIISLNEGAP